MRRLTRIARLVTLAALLPAVAHSGLQAQRYQTTTQVDYLAVGIRTFDFTELNGRLRSHGYTQLDDAVLALGAGGYRLYRSIAIGGDINFLGGRRKEAQDGHYNLLIYGATAALNLGYPLRQTPRLTVLPTVGLGATGIKLNIEDRTSGSFDEVLEAPGRSSSLARSSIALNAGLALDLTPSARSGMHGWRGTVIGLRSGYSFSPASGPWRLNQSDVSGSPDLDLHGFYFTLTFGRRRLIGPAS